MGSAKTSRAPTARKLLGFACLAVFFVLSALDIFIICYLSYWIHLERYGQGKTWGERFYLLRFVGCIIALTVGLLCAGYYFKTRMTNKKFLTNGFLAMFTGLSVLSTIKRDIKAGLCKVISHANTDFCETSVIKALRVLDWQAPIGITWVIACFAYMVWDDLAVWDKPHTE